MLIALLRVLAPLSVLLLSAPAEANPNPNHRLTIAKENAVKQTSVGLDAAEAYEARTNNAQLLYGATDKVFETVKIDGQWRLRFNLNLNSSSFEYLSWIVMAGLVDYNIQTLVRQDFGVKLPHFIETDFFVFAASMEYYEETGFASGGAIDYANHPSFNYAREQMLSLSKMQQLWRNDRPAFFENLVLRRKKLDGSVTTLESYLQRTDLTRRQREAAQMLEQLYGQNF